MRLVEISYSGALPIDSYGPGFFRIGGEVVRSGLLVTPQGWRAWSGFEDLAALAEQAGSLDVLFVGTGPELRHLPPGFRDPLEAAGIGVEAMPTPSACRTYNVLLSEGRRVGIALFLV